MEKTLKTGAFAVACLIIASFAQAQERKPLGSFNKITASPLVNLILERGEKESIRIVYNDIPEDKVNVIITGNKLKIYLDDARMMEKQVRVSHTGNTEKRGIYRGSSITAYVTFKELKAVQIRGDQELRCDGELKADKFKLKAYGENEIRLASLDARKFKVSLYGKNDVRIKSGATSDQVYRLYGENKINTVGLKSATATTRIYGEGKVSINASDEVRINSFGEPTISVAGTSVISRGIIVGRADIRVQR